MRVGDEETDALARTLGLDVDRIALAPFVARDYHGGQGSALYALASTGTVVPRLAREAYEAARIAVDDGEYEEAEALTEVGILSDHLDEEG